MVITAAPDQIKRIVENQHPNPFDVLGSHPIEQEGTTGWVVRAYLPDVEQAWVIHPEARAEYAMAATHHPHFFECQIDTPELAANYLIKTQVGDRQQVMRDPYAFKTPLLTDYDLHLFGEGNHHRIYDKLGAHRVTLDGVTGV
ncbi:MAG: 1,4-alpha-glucan branching enzyme, partial [Cyanobacteria bacterium]|nr:1,4-alpha-glucan branching enzyme [Cyanobacteriota bacterium]